MSAASCCYRTSTSGSSGCSGRRNGLGVGGERGGDGVGRGRQRGTAARRPPRGAGLRARVGQHGADGGGQRRRDLPARPAPLHRRRPGRGCRRPGWPRWPTPARSASCRISGWPSHWLGSTNTVAAASRFGTSSRCPRNAASTPSEAARARSSPASGPSPAIASSGGGSRSRQVRRRCQQRAEVFLRSQAPNREDHGSSGRGADGPGVARVAVSAGGVSVVAGAAGGTIARPTRRAPAARIRASRSGDTHSTRSAPRATTRFEQAVDQHPGSSAGGAARCAP